MTVDDNSLAHYGVKGMQWGVRRKRGSDGRVVKGKKSSTSKTKYKKAPSKLSDTELKRRIQRMEMEKKYNELNASSVSSGKKYVKGILEGTGKQAVAVAVGGVVSYKVQQALKKND